MDSKALLADTNAIVKDMDRLNRLTTAINGDLALLESIKKTEALLGPVKEASQTQAAALARLRVTAPEWYGLMNKYSSVLDNVVIPDSAEIEAEIGAAKIFGTIKGGLN